MTTKILRELFRNLQAFKDAYEAHGIDTIEWRGESYCVWDIEYLYRQLHCLSPRQRQSIELFLVQNISERDVAVMMGLSPNNPIGAYATDGLNKLCDLIKTGAFPRYREHDDLVEGAA